MSDKKASASTDPRMPVDLLEVLQRRSGLARTSDFEQAGIPRWRLSRLVNVGILERVRRGLYRAADLPMTPDLELVQVCAAIPHSVVFLASALFYYGLTTYYPNSVWLAVRQNDRPVHLVSPPIRLHFLTPKYHQMGVSQISTPSGRIRIYDREKTLCDCIRFRNKIGLDVAIEALRNYLKSPGASRDRILKYARLCRVESTMRRYLEAMI